MIKALSPRERDHRASVRISSDRQPRPSGRWRRSCGASPPYVSRIEKKALKSCLGSPSGEPMSFDLPSTPFGIGGLSHEVWVPGGLESPWLRASRCGGISIRRAA